MRTILLIPFVIIFWGAQAQIVKYKFSIAPDAVNMLDYNERDSILQRLDGFLDYKNGPAEQNPFIDKNYVRNNRNPFEFFRDIENGGNDSVIYKPTVLTILPVIAHQKYIIKISYMGVSEQKTVKLRLIYTLIAKKIIDDYYFFNAIDFNVRHWSEKQVGSIHYIFPNKLNITKARLMDRFNRMLASKFSTQLIPVSYYRCDDPEQLLKMMGFDYITNMYLSTSGGFAQPGNNIILAGNNSEIYQHELVHFYTNKIFKNTNRIINEGYATYMGGTGGWTLEQTKLLANKYLNQNLDCDIKKVFVNFDRVEHNIPFTYIASGLICKDIETKYGFLKIKDLFQAENDDQYFKILQRITGITTKQFPDYVRHLINDK